MSDYRVVRTVRDGGSIGLYDVHDLRRVDLDEDSGALLWVPAKPYEFSTAWGVRTIQRNLIDALDALNHPVVDWDALEDWQKED